ncbi:hypothetical protein OIDMADRAFT_133318, partial [Oidiodendron maius Zn]
FDIARQRLPHSVIEDSVRKPCRTMPSGRTSPDEGRWLLLAVIPAVIFFVFVLSGMTLATVGLTWMYNDLEGACENYILRNIINAFGFVSYSSGATIVAAGYGQYDLN